LSLSARLTAAMGLLVVLTAFAVGALSYRNIETTLVPAELARLQPRAELARLQPRAELQAIVLNTHVLGARADVLSGMGPASLEGFVRTHAMGLIPNCRKRGEEGIPWASWK
jgi:hypothetical protein